MKIYRIGIMLILFMILSIGAISAEAIDDSASMDSVDDSISVDGVDDSISDTSPEENIKSENENNGEIIGEGETRDFTALNKTIYDSLETGIISLDCNYAFDSATDADFTYGIILEEQDNLVIEGNNHTIDANNQAGIFKLNGCRMTLQNLVLKNSNRSALIMNEANIRTINVTFESNFDSFSGAAAYTYAGYYYSFNDTFINNRAPKGSSIFSDGSDVIISNSSFNDGDIDWAMIYGVTYGGEEGIFRPTLNISDCTFSNLHSNYATVIYNDYITNIQRSTFENLKSITGGAIGIKSYPTEEGMPSLLCISDSKFINVSSLKNGGAIFADMIGNSFVEDMDLYGSVAISNSLFDACASMFGGALTQLGGFLNIINTNFTNNNASYLGGAIYASGVTADIANSLFENNTAQKDSFFETGDGESSLANRYGKFNSGAIYCDNRNLTLKGSNFTKNSGAISLMGNYFDISGNNFNENGVAIKTYFDFSDSKMGTNNFGSDNVSLDNYFYDLSINETGAEIDFNPIIIPASASDSSFDLRDYDLVSPVKNQGQMGACWAFGTAGALESAILKATNRSLSLDISENNMKGTMLAYSLLGSKAFTEGATVLLPVSYLLSYLGVVNETEDSFDQFGKISPIFLNKNSYHVQELVMIPARNISNPEQCAEIDRQLKEALIKYGAVTIYINGASADYEGYNEDTSSQYIGDPDAKANHFVTLVGWNDSYDKSKFLSYTYGNVTVSPKNNGAWIAKNSWGSDFGDDGFYYISYEDTTFAKTYSIAYVINQTPLYNTVYQYDYDFIGFDEMDDNCTNYFIADEDLTISAVGTYFNGTGEDYTFLILIGDNDIVAYKQSGKSLHSGYQTIEFDRKIAVKKGEMFAVAMKARLCPYLADSKIIYGKGSYVDGEEYSLQGVVACLKAYAFANPISVNLNYLSSDKITVFGPGGAEAVVEFNGKNTTIRFDSSGKAILDSALKLGDYMANIYYNNNVASYPIHVFESVDIISAVTIAYNTHLELDTFYFDLNDTPLANAPVLVKLDSQSPVKLFTDGNGFLIITLDDASIGTHTITVTNTATGESAVCKVKVVSRFSNNKNIVMDYADGSKYKVRVYNDLGKLAGAGQIVVFKLNKKTYKVKTDKNGWAYLKIPKTVVPKKYTVTATYRGQTVKNSIKVKQILKSKNYGLKKSAKKWILKATLKNSKKKALKGKVIRFKVNGKTYKAKTNRKGIAKVTIKRKAIKKFKKGKTYKVSISYLKDTIKKRIKVKA